MDLRWWWVIIVGVLALAACVSAAALFPMAEVRRVLRPLANVDRLVRLPEYARVYRIYFLSMLITGVLLLGTFAAALAAGARPVGLSSTSEEFETQHPHDIMLCVGEPVTDPTTASFLTHYAEQAKSYDKQRIGLTSPSLRVVPLTGDHDYATQRFEYFANMARLQQDLDTGKPLSDSDRARLQMGIGEFSQPITYVDYARSLEDILALCMTGFPSFEGKSTHRRSLVYIGYSALQSSDEQRGSLYSEQDVKNMAAAAGIQVNAISRSDVAQSSPEANDALRSITDATDGQFSLYNPVGTATVEGGRRLHAHQDPRRDSGQSAHSCAAQRQVGHQRILGFARSVAVRGHGCRDAVVRVAGGAAPMTFDPILAPAILLMIAAVLVVIRMVALYRVLVRTATGSYRRVVLRWFGLTLAVLLVVLAAARPGFDLDDEDPAEQPNTASVVDPNLNVFFLVDRSVNSRVEDFGDGETRMAGIRDDITALINEYPRARFALIAFAAEASLDWPLSDDAWSLKSLVQGLGPYTLVAPDAMYRADPAAASELLNSQLESAPRSFPTPGTWCSTSARGQQGRTTGRHRSIRQTERSPVARCWDTGPRPEGRSRRAGWMARRCITVTPKPARR